MGEVIFSVDDLGVPTFVRTPFDVGSSPKYLYDPVGLTKEDYLADGSLSGSPVPMDESDFQMLLYIMEGAYYFEELSYEDISFSETGELILHEDDVDVYINLETYNITVKDPEYGEIIEELTVEELIQYYG